MNIGRRGIFMFLDNLGNSQNKNQGFAQGRQSFDKK